MQIAKYCFLALFAVTSAIHLYHSWTNEHKKRAVTKPMLLLSLIGFYVCSADPISLLLLFALITSWLGDVLLIPKGNAWFISGGISFLISHILFILTYSANVSASSAMLPVVIPVSVLYLFISAAVMYSVRKTTPKPMFVPMFLYLAANSTMNIFALMQLLTLKNAGALIAFIGAVLFFTSDCTLFLLRYHENKKLIFKKHFTIMLTYLAGEFLITFGMLML